MIRIRKGEHMVLLGTTGSGKTEFFRRAIMPQADRLLVVDTEDRQFLDLEPIKTPDGDRVARAIPKPPQKFRWKWVPPATMDQAVEQLDNLCNRLLNRPEAESMFLYVDEVTDFSDAYRISEWLRAYARKARKRAQSIVSASQRPAGFNRWLWDNSVHKVLFYVKVDEIETIERRFGKRIAEALKAVEWESYESLYIDPAGTVHHLKAASK